MWAAAWESRTPPELNYKPGLETDRAFLLLVPLKSVNLYKIDIKYKKRGFDPMKRLNASVAREEFSELLNQVSYLGERIIVHRRGKNVAALVSLEDLQLIQEIEDRLDNAAADAALEEAGASIPWEQVKKDLAIK
jgi:antitoxin Phd